MSQSVLFQWWYHPKPWGPREQPGFRGLKIVIGDRRNEARRRGLQRKIPDIVGALSSCLISQANFTSHCLAPKLEPRPYHETVCSPAEWRQPPTPGGGEVTCIYDFFKLARYPRSERVRFPRWYANPFVTEEWHRWRSFEFLGIGSYTGGANYSLGPTVERTKIYKGRVGL